MGRNINRPMIVSAMVIPVSPPADLLRTTLCPLVLNLVAIYYSPTFASAFLITTLEPYIIMKRITAIAEA